MQAYICFIELIGWRPHRSIEMISSSIDFSHLMVGMTPVPAGMLHKPSLKQVVLTTDVKILKQLIYGDIYSLSVIVIVGSNQCADCTKYT